MENIIIINMQKPCILNSVNEKWMHSKHTYNSSTILTPSPPPPPAQIVLHLHSRFGAAQFNSIHTFIHTFKHLKIQYKI